MYNTHPQHQNYVPQHNGYGYAPMQQQMPVAAPVAQSAAAGKGVLMIAGLAVVGAAAFGGVYLMNSSSQPEQPAVASQPSTVFNIPSEINIPGLNTNDDPASPVVVNNPAPVRVFTQQAPRSNGSTPAPVQHAPATAPVEQKSVEQKPVEEPKKEEPKKEEPKPDTQTGTVIGGTA